MKTVYPSPDLPDGHFLPGIGADGAELPDRQADDLIKRGLAVEKKHKPKQSAAPAEPEE